MNLEFGFNPFTIALDVVVVGGIAAFIFNKKFRNGVKNAFGANTKKLVGTCDKCGKNFKLAEVIVNAKADDEGLYQTDCPKCDGKVEFRIANS